MTNHKDTLRYQTMLEARRAIEALRLRDLRTARERLLLALSWLEEIEPPKAEVVQ